MREEARVEVEVGPVLRDVPADPPDGTYTRWRTFRCRIIRGEPAPGDGESREAELRDDPYLYPQLLRIRGALEEPPGSGPPAG